MQHAWFQRDGSSLHKEFPVTTWKRKNVVITRPPTSSEEERCLGGGALKVSLRLHLDSSDHAPQPSTYEGKDSVKTVRDERTTTNTMVGLSLDTWRSLVPNEFLLQIPTLQSQLMPELTPNAHPLVSRLRPIFLDYQRILHECSP